MPVGLNLLLAFAAGGVLFFIVGWALGSRRQAPPPAADDRLEAELRQQLTQRDADLEKIRAQLADVGKARSDADAKHLAAEKLLAQQRTDHDRVLREAKEIQAKALHDLREAFKALSAEALKQNAPDFLRLAEQSFAKFQEAAKGDLAKLQESAKGDLAQRQEAIKGLVAPLKEQLESYQKRLQQSEALQSGALGEVRKQLETLSQSSLSLAAETAQFRSVLKSNQARGRWGEETLRRIVEAAGMSAHCDFVEQSRGDEVQPDLIVRLPGDRVIIVDSKVPDLEIATAADAAEPGRRSEMLAAHATRVRNTVKGLADRNYPEKFANALDHVVLFVPAESLFSAALEGDPDLIVWAESKQVYLATPASFIAVLRTINFIWQQHAQSQNAKKIAEAAQEFYGRVVKFVEHFDRLRAGLERANHAFNEAAASFQTRVRPAGERLAELGGGTAGKELPDVQPLDVMLRLPSAATESAVKPDEGSETPQQILQLARRLEPSPPVELEKPPEAAG